MTYIQIFTGGQPITPAAIAAAGATPLFTAEVDGWHQPPNLPSSPDRVDVSKLPRPVRDLLDKALSNALLKATGRRWRPAD